MRAKVRAFVLISPDMLFKNLQLFALPAKFSTAPGTLETALARHPLLSCNAASMESRGWVAPAESGPLVHSQGQQLLIALGVQQRLLPASVIRQAVKERATALEKQQGYAPGRKQLRDLKDRVADELRPRAFLREKRVQAWLDLAQHRFVVNAAAPRVADDLASVLRADLGEFPALPLETQQSVGSALTSWVIAGRAPGAFTLDQDCELVGSEDAQAAVRYVRHGLDGAEIRSLIKNGKTVSRVGLLWRDRLSFVLSDKLAIKRLRFQAIKEEGQEGDKHADRFEADFALMSGELGEMLKELLGHLGGTKAPD